MQDPDLAALIDYIQRARNATAANPALATSTPTGIRLFESPQALQEFRAQRGLTTGALHASTPKTQVHKTQAHKKAQTQKQSPFEHTLTQGAQTQGAQTTHETNTQSKQYKTNTQSNQLLNYLTYILGGAAAGAVLSKLQEQLPPATKQPVIETKPRQYKAEPRNPKANTYTKPAQTVERLQDTHTKAEEARLRKLKRAFDRKLLREGLINSLRAIE